MIKEKREELSGGEEPRFGFEAGGLLEGEPTWDRMTKIAAICVSLARKHFGETLDYSPESLAVVDRIIMSGWGYDGIKNPKTDLTTLFGAYLGEIVVRRTRGRWVSGFSDEEPASILYVGTGDRVQASFSPFMMIREKFQDPTGLDLALLPNLLEQIVSEVETEHMKEATASPESSGDAE